MLTNKQQLICQISSQIYSSTLVKKANNPLWSSFDKEEKREIEDQIISRVVEIATSIYEKVEMMHNPWGVGDIVLVQSSDGISYYKIVSSPPNSQGKYQGLLCQQDGTILYQPGSNKPSLEFFCESQILTRNPLKELPLNY
ncbi:hypothetical protein [Crocosphaera sp. Alani8]|uniref:hypothetical protein n=1 Tax=Crocosphaera sp. Alani8 TaxID=3038952 RepID=UPI00313EAF20